MSVFKAILIKWQNDLSFREEFKKNPEFALSKAGFNLSQEDLNKIIFKIDSHLLENRENK